MSDEEDNQQNIATESSAPVDEDIVLKEQEEEEVVEQNEIVEDEEPSVEREEQPPAKELHRGASTDQDSSHHKEKNLDEWNPAEHDGKSEAELRMEQEKKKRIEKANEEWTEYEEMRKIEREREKQEIRELRERREKRRQERAEEEKRLAEIRAQEDQRRRAEEDERQRKKREDESKKRAEREKRQQELKEKLSGNAGKPNFVIGKRLTGIAMPNDGTPAEEQKTKEQLEAERKAMLEQRITSLNINGFNASQLTEKAKELHNLIYSLESEKYDMQQRFEQQNYDIMDMTERARQMTKGAGKSGKVNINTTPDPLAAKMSGIPQKITMYSEYERVKDHRSFDERKVVFKGPLYDEGVQRIQPSNRIEMTEQGARIVNEIVQQNGDVNGSHAVNGNAEEVEAEA